MSLPATPPAVMAAITARIARLARFWAAASVGPRPRVVNEITARSGLRLTVADPVTCSALPLAAEAARAEAVSDPPLIVVYAATASTHTAAVSVACRRCSLMAVSSAGKPVGSSTVRGRLWFPRRTRRCQGLLQSITIPAEQVSAFTPFRLQKQEFFMRFDQLAITGGTSGGRPRGAARIC